MKHFKARIIKPSRDWHAIVVYLDAPNILTAGTDIMNVFMPLGILPEQVVQLIEIEEVPNK